MQIRRTDRVKRLTKTYSNGYVTINAEGFHQSQETIDNEVRNSEAFAAAVMRLKEYEDYYGAGN